MDPEVILNSGIRLLEFLERRWQVQTGNRREQRIQALRLGFIEHSAGTQESDDDSDLVLEEPVDDLEKADGAAVVPSPHKATLRPKTKKKE